MSNPDVWKEVNQDNPNLKLDSPSARIEQMGYWLSRGRARVATGLLRGYIKELIKFSPMSNDEKVMQAKKIRLMKIALTLGVVFAAYFVWRVEVIIQLLSH